MGGHGHEHFLESHLRIAEEGRAGDFNQVPERLTKAVKEILALVRRDSWVFHADDLGKVVAELPVRRGDFNQRRLPENWEQVLAQMPECSILGEANVQIKLAPRISLDADGEVINDNDFIGLLTARIRDQIKNDDVKVLFFTRDLQPFENELRRIVHDVMREIDRKNEPSIIFGADRRKHPRQP